ncbi:MAG TPA: hypothetical protein PKC50_03220, partial [Elusimicrobiota bacterium]|nr:hypothetical protein [Elusimicrobiota bacterium]
MSSKKAFSPRPFNVVLAALLLAAQRLYGNSRPSTVQALLVGYLGDVEGEDGAIDRDGNVTPGTIAYNL